MTMIRIISPGRTEGNGRRVLEATAAGCPEGNGPGRWRGHYRPAPPPAQRRTGRSEAAPERRSDRDPRLVTDGEVPQVDVRIEHRDRYIAGHTRHWMCLTSRYSRMPHSPSSRPK